MRKKNSSRARHVQKRVLGVVASVPLIMLFSPSIKNLMKLKTAVFKAYWESSNDERSFQYLLDRHCIWYIVQLPVSDAPGVILILPAGVPVLCNRFVIELVKVIDFQQGHPVKCGFYSIIVYAK